MTLDDIENVIAILNAERKFRGGDNIVTVDVQKDSGEIVHIDMTVDQALAGFFELRKRKMQEEDE